MSRPPPRTPLAHPRGSFQTESLEPRRLLAVAYPSNLEQYAVEVINRARANPAAEAARLGIDLNEGLAAGTISAAAKQPLAVSPILTASARGHSQWMLNNDVFSHTGSGGSNPNDRMAAAGYKFIAPWNWAENIAWRSSKRGTMTAANIDQLQEDLFVDTPIADRGHRINMLNSAVREIGAGFLSGSFQGYSHAGMLTTDFASTAGNAFFTGVAYQDNVTKDNFYTPGEGLAGVTVTATRVSDSAVFSTTTFPSGGYSLQVPPGTYQVMASGAGLAQPTAFSSVVIGSENVEKDFVKASTSTPPMSAQKRPTAALMRALRMRFGQRYYAFDITYNDNVAVNGATFDNSDILVTGPDGFARLANFNAGDRSNGTPRLIDYVVKGPGGAWDSSENGVYTITLQPKQISDTSGRVAVSVQLGAFSVKIAAAPSPAAVVAPVTTSAAAVRQKDQTDDLAVFA